MRAVRAGLIGFGSVGRRLLLELYSHPLVRGRVEVGYILSSRGGVRGGLDEALRLAGRDEKLDNHSEFMESLGYRDILGDVELAFIAIPPSYAEGEPNLTMYSELLGRGVSIITADKTGLALRYSTLTGLAERMKAYIGYRATVAAGIPAIDAARGLRGRRIREVRAVLNATTNYILGFVEKGLSLSEAIRRAVEERLAEPDPRIDVEGWDAAAKIAILSSTLGYEASIRDVDRRPLTELGEEEIREAAGRGFRAKYIAEAHPAEKELKVYPTLLEADNPLARTESNENTIIFSLEEEGEVLLSGPVGPAWRTAKTMITDLIEYLEWRSRIQTPVA